MDVVAEDERLLAGVLWDGLDSIDGVTQLHQWTDAPDRVGVAAFTAEGWEAHELGTHLADRGIAVRAGSFCAHPFVAHLLGVESTRTAWLLHEAECGEDVTIPGAVRASIGLATTRADIDALLGAVAEAAAVAAA